MYVCVCKAVTEAKLKSQIEAGASSFDQVQQSCGAASKCGMCRLKVERMLRQAREEVADKTAEPQRASG